MTGQRFFRHGELPLVILALLERQPMHGYQILVELERLFGDDYEPSTGTIYPAITALEEERLITSRKEGRRKIYHLNQLGEDALARRADSLAEVELRTNTRVRSNGSVESMLDHFSGQIRAISKRIEPGNDERVLKKLQGILNRTVSELEGMTPNDGGDE